MILYKAIQYKILEYCLDIFFERLKLNFPTKRIDWGILESILGKRTFYSKIVWKGYSHFDCKIINVQEYNDQYFLGFKCSHHNNTDPDIYKNQISADGTTLIIISFRIFDLIEFIP
jgi:hypothetical protein